MKVVLFGASGMIGQGALRECLNDSQVTGVLAVVRNTTGVKHGKLRELVHSDFSDLGPLGAQLSGYDACFFCLGTSSAGMNEAEYKVITYDYTLAAARTLLQRNPALTFIYISGAGADPTEQGRVMWARVRGKAENDLLKLSDKVYIIRPAVIEPLHGIEARQRWTRILYKVSSPLIPLLRAALPQYVTDTERLGRAMLNIARRGAGKHILHTADVNAIAQPCP